MRVYGSHWLSISGRIYEWISENSSVATDDLPPQRGFGGFLPHAFKGLVLLL